MSKIVVMLSGGIDSVVMTHALKKSHHDLLALTIYYGQRHAKEVQYAMLAAKDLNVPWYQIHVSGWRTLIPNNTVISGDVNTTPVVPNRNAIMLNIAASVAIGQEYDTVAFAAHAGDYEVFPDCRQQFFKALQESIQEGTNTRISIHTPFINLTKEKIIRLGVELGAPFEKTWSCYLGQANHCGKCMACIGRRQAFK
jgi:7-cyano-7-deazaguanine synthase